MEVAVPMELHYKHSFLTAQEAIEATDRERSQSEPPPPSRELEVAEDAQHEVSKKTSYTAGLLQKAVYVGFGVCKSDQLVHPVSFDGQLLSEDARAAIAAASFESRFNFSSTSYCPIEGSDVKYLRGETRGITEMLLRALNFCSADQLKAQGSWVTLENSGTVLAEAVLPMRASIPDVSSAGGWGSKQPYIELELLQLVDGSLPAALGSKPLMLALENKQEQLVRGYLSFDYVERLSLQEQALCITAAIQQRSPFMLLQLLDQIHPTHEHLIMAIRLGQEHLLDPLLHAGGLALVRSKQLLRRTQDKANKSAACSLPMAMLQRARPQSLRLCTLRGSRSLRTFPQINPRTSETFKVYEEMGGDEVQRILSSAAAAQQAWRRRSASERVAAFAPLATALRSRAEEVADLVCQEMGKPVQQGKAEVLKCAYLVDWYVENGAKFLEDTEYPALPGFQKSFVTYQPLGTVLSVMPWNFPIWQVIRMGIPTLMAGNAVLLKHAPNCFGSGLACEDMLAQLDIPDGLFRSLIIDVPQVSTVLEHPSVQGVALTGSEGAGRAVAAKAGGLLKKAVIELGGSDAYAVLADADLDVAADAVVNARVANSGQTCIAPKRAIVDKRIKAAFEQKVMEKVALKKYGVDFGPLVHPKGRDDVAAQVEESQAQGARLLCGGPTAPPTGDCGTSFYPPTVLTDVKPGMTAFETEIFGPVIAIIEAEDEEDILRLANQTSYGLAGAVFTKDVRKGERLAVKEIEAGMCFVNDFVRSDPSLPFGGVKNSGLGRECAAFGMLEFVNVKTICVKQSSGPCTEFYGPGGLRLVRYAYENCRLVDKGGDFHLQTTDRVEPMAVVSGFGSSQFFHRCRPIQDSSLQCSEPEDVPTFARSTPYIADACQTVRSDGEASGFGLLSRCKVSWAWAVVNVGRGFTPLHLACQMGHWHLISCLVEAMNKQYRSMSAWGPSPQYVSLNVADVYGRTALDIALLRYFNDESESYGTAAAAEGNGQKAVNVLREFIHRRPADDAGVVCGWELLQVMNLIAIPSKKAMNAQLADCNRMVEGSPNSANADSGEADKETAEGFNDVREVLEAVRMLVKAGAQTRFLLEDLLEPATNPPVASPIFKSAAQPARTSPKYSLQEGEVGEMEDSVDDESFTS
ncbi:sad [Symbiodinium sp. KB8]|nr:sad [Symbiodinium sp. KB8]